ncbi:MAG: phosphoglycolate phosphatase [Candidatus Competibacterales bacterium]|nr:phosphoglycolate phosphatase [Candidatus Competibacterales bacterium]
MTPQRPAPTCVLFDLDGTLLDTAPDLGQALNRLLAERGRSPLSAERIRPVVSHGSIGLLGLGFGVAAGHPEFESLRARFLALYGAALAEQTTLFPGMAAVLQTLERRGMPWGVVTNKPAALTEPLLAALGLAARAACIVSGDSVARAKPDPLPLLHACARIGVAPDRCLYVGDAERDVQAGRRAGMTTLVARYGYLAADERPEAWGADGLIDSPQALCDWL